MTPISLALEVEFLGLTMSTLGEILLAGTVLMVHHKIKKEHKIDQFVIKEITLEQLLGTSSIILMIAGYFLQIDFFGQYLPSLIH